MVAQNTARTFTQEAFCLHDMDREASNIVDAAMAHMKINTPADGSTRVLGQYVRNAKMEMNNISTSHLTPRMSCEENWTVKKRAKKITGANMSNPRNADLATARTGVRLEAFAPERGLHGR